MVAFVAMHSLPAEHFLIFQSLLAKNSIPTRMIVGGVAKKALGSRLPDVDMDVWEGKEIKEFSNEVAKSCEFANIIFVGIGHQFAGHFLEAITELYGSLKRVILYYENPEVYVPGGYSDLAQSAVTLGRPEEVLFANKNLAKKGVSVCKGLERVRKIGLGYYPMHDVEVLKKLRAEKKVEASRVFVYLGGAEANTDYFDKALPAFIEMLSKISFLESPTTLIFRKHPRSSGADWSIVKAFEMPGLTVVLDIDSLLNTLARADYTFYYQTSLSPLLILGGVNPIQVGHEVYREVLVDKGLIPVATSTEGLGSLLGNSMGIVDDEVVFNAIGFDPLWENNLLGLLVKGV